MDEIRESDRCRTDVEHVLPGERPECLRANKQRNWERTDGEKNGGASKPPGERDEISTSAFGRHPSAVALDSSAAVAALPFSASDSGEPEEARSLLGNEKWESFIAAT
ncbi:hypothetical protein HPB50_016833 [Hyalomma asiaticum]|uniref:Uncharacterized protein n=1 Tax=Hyalomma asiaticum TaxID=266040 RepID=A0ACB7S343_HYAAI|nr:hypothetical protein HPB50_016833 [Hyalomma asiaticum]